VTQGVGPEFKPQYWKKKKGIDKWDCIKIKSFCTAKETITRIKKHPTEWEKIFSSYSLYKVSISKIYKKLQKLNTKRTKKIQLISGQMN
jgi:hypothetical protein